MAEDLRRLLRLRAEGLGDAGPRRPRRESTARFLGRVVDGGAMPTALERYTLMRPCRLDGPDVAGLAASVLADPSREVPVVWLGPKPPKVGELAVAHAVGGRWVADRGGDSETVSCGGCEIPRGPLTLTLVNTLLGTFTAPMAFDGAGEWATGCVAQISFRLSCVGGERVFYASHFSGGPCPTGSPTTCIGPGTAPLGLTPIVQTCDPLMLRYTTANCPALAAQGYTTLTVTL